MPWDTVEEIDWVSAKVSCTSLTLSRTLAVENSVLKILLDIDSLKHRFWSLYIYFCNLFRTFMLYHAIYLQVSVLS